MKRTIETGYGTITKSAMQDKNLTIEAKAIYAYLCSFAGSKDIAWPSISMMCFDLKIDVKRFRKHMKLLLESGYVSVEKNRFHGEFSSNRYMIVK